MNLRSGVQWALFCFLAAVLACNPREPGCLDVDAENFDFAAEKHDQSTCVYPDLLLNVQYEWGDTTFALGVPYENDLEQVFAIESFYLLLSQFVIIDSDGIRTMVDDVVDWYLSGPGETIPVPDDFVLVDRTRFDFVLGPIRKSGFQDRLQFTLGVPDTLIPTVRDSLPTTHVLRTSRVDYDSAMNRFSTARFVINRDTSGQLLDTLVLFSSPETFDYTLDKLFVQGRNDTVRIAIDLRTLFGPLALDRPLSDLVSDLSSSVHLAVRNNN